jgi:3-methyl-2-oxobutanoate hydroxymethyltransferase
MINGCLVQGQDENSARLLVEAAEELEEAGAFAIILNCVTSVSARFLAEKLEVPVIGVGAGADVDGQQLPYEQLLGLEPNTACYARKYADLHEICMSALATFCADVREGRFPAEDECFAMDPDEAQKLY